MTLVWLLSCHLILSPEFLSIRLCVDQGFFPLEETSGLDSPGVCAEYTLVEAFRVWHCAGGWGHSTQARGKEASMGASESQKKLWPYVPVGWG